MKTVKLTGFKKTITIFDGGEIHEYQMDEKTGQKRTVFKNNAGKMFNVLEIGQKVNDGRVYVLTLGSEIESSRKELFPFMLSSPGTLLEKELYARGVTIENLVLMTGPDFDFTYWNNFIVGVSEISFDSAIELEKALGIPAEFWVTAQIKYKKWLMNK